MTSARQVKARDGSSLSYWISGSKAPRVVLVHSLAMDHWFWQPVVNRLSADCEILCVDCRGHGASDKPAGPYSVELFADDLSDVMDAAGWSSAIVGGASMGGCVSIAFAQRHPNKTCGLGLIDTTAWYGETAEKDWTERADRAATGGLVALVEFQKSRWFGDRFRQEHPHTIDECVRVFLNNDPKAYRETCLMLGRADLRVGLSGIAAPTAIVVGEEDYATPLSMATALRDAIPSASLQVLKDARHFTAIERADEIASALRSLARA